MATTPKTIRAAAVQIAPDFERPEGTLERVCAAIDEAAAKGVQMMVFPETFMPYYPYFSFVLPPVLQGAPHLKLYERAVVVPGPVTAVTSYTSNGLTGFALSRDGKQLALSRGTATSDVVLITQQK